MPPGFVGAVEGAIADTVLGDVVGKVVVGAVHAHHAGFGVVVAVVKDNHIICSCAGVVGHIFVRAVGNTVPVGMDMVRIGFVVDALCLTCLSVVVAEQVVGSRAGIPAPPVGRVREVQDTVIHRASLHAQVRYDIISKCTLRLRTPARAQVRRWVSHFSCRAVFREFAYLIRPKCCRIAPKHAPSQVVILGKIPIRACRNAFTITIRALVSKGIFLANLNTYSKSSHSIAKQGWVLRASSHALAVSCAVITPVWRHTVLHTSFVGGV